LTADDKSIRQLTLSHRYPRFYLSAFAIAMVWGITSLMSSFTRGGPRTPLL
jgi:hypothetical protein